MSEIDLEQRVAELEADLTWHKNYVRPPADPNNPVPIGYLFELLADPQKVIDQLNQRITEFYQETTTLEAAAGQMRAALSQVRHVGLNSPASQRRDLLAICDGASTDAGRTYLEVVKAAVARDKARKAYNDYVVCAHGELRTLDPDYKPGDYHWELMKADAALDKAVAALEAHHV